MDEQSPTVYVAKKAHSMSRASIVVLSIFFVLAPIISIISALMADTFHPTILLLFLLWIIPRVIIWSVSDGLRYKVIITDDCIMGRKLRPYFLENDGTEETAPARAFEKESILVLFAEVKDASVHNQRFGSGLSCHWRTFIIFELRNGEQRKIDISWSGEDMEKIIAKLQKKIAVTDSRTEKNYWY